MFFLLYTPTCTTSASPPSTVDSPVPTASTSRAPMALTCRSLAAIRSGRRCCYVRNDPAAFVALSTKKNSTSCPTAVLKRELRTGSKHVFADTNERDTAVAALNGWAEVSIPLNSLRQTRACTLTMGHLSVSCSVSRTCNPIRKALLNCTAVVPPRVLSTYVQHVAQ